MAGQVDTARASADLGRDCSLVSIDGNANLDLTKVARPDSVEVGDRIEYTITVHNAGTTPVFAPVVLDRPLDGRIQLLSAASAAGRCRVLGQGTSGQRVRCVLRDIAADEAVTIVVAARAREPGRTVDRATVLSLPPPSNGDNTDTASVVIRPRAAGEPRRRGLGPTTETTVHGLMRAPRLRRAGGRRRAARHVRCAGRRATPPGKRPRRRSGLTCSGR